MFDSIAEQAKEKDGVNMRLHFNDLIKYIFNLALMGLGVLLLNTCGTASTPSGEASPVPVAQSTPSPAVATTPAVGATRNTLTREQYVRAMACAAEQAAPGARFRFQSQWTAYQDSSAQASWDQAMAMGGDGQYIIYTQAVSLGCLGTEA